MCIEHNLLIDIIISIKQHIINDTYPYNDTQ